MFTEPILIEREVCLIVELSKVELLFVVLAIGIGVSVEFVYDLSGILYVSQDKRNI